MPSALRIAQGASQLLIASQGASQLMIASQGAASRDLPFCAQIAHALNLPIVSVHDFDAAHVDANELEAELSSIKSVYDAASLRLAGALLTGVPAAGYSTHAADLRRRMQKLGVFPIGMLPLERRLAEVTISDVASSHHVCF